MLGWRSQKLEVRTDEMGLTERTGRSSPGDGSHTETEAKMQDARSAASSAAASQRGTMQHVATRAFPIPHPIRHPPGHPFQSTIPYPYTRSQAPFSPLSTRHRHEQMRDQTLTTAKQERHPRSRIGSRPGVATKVRADPLTSYNCEARSISDVADRGRQRVGKV